MVDPCQIEHARVAGAGPVVRRCPSV
jgi:hypothetical protein